MIRVLHFADIVNRYDFIDNIIRRADPTRFSMGLCVRSDHNNIAAPIYPEHTPRWTLNGTSRKVIPQAAWQLARLLRRWDAHILHTHHYDEAFIGWLATRLHPKTRLVVGRHYSDAIYRLPSALKQRALLAIEAIANRGATRIIVPSDYLVEILTHRQGVDPGKVDRIPYGFEPEKYETPSVVEVERLRRDLDPGGRLLFGTFCRFHEEKGHRFLLDAITLLEDLWPSVQFVFVGEGAERQSIERQISENGLGRVVRLLGWRRDAMALMAAMDGIVQPTLQEAFSQVMAEALWMRKPLIITQVSGSPDIVKDGTNGLLVPKEDPVALAGAIRRLVEDAALRDQLGSAGRAYVEDHLMISQVVGRYEASYLRAMGA